MLGCNFDSLCLIFGCIFTPCMSIYFLFKGAMLVFGFPAIGVLILYTYIGDYGVFSLRKMKKYWTYKFMCSKISVIKKCICGAEVVVYLLILC